MLYCFSFDNRKHLLLAKELESFSCKLFVGYPLLEFPRSTHLTTGGASDDFWVSEILRFLLLMGVAALRSFSASFPLPFLLGDLSTSKSKGFHQAVVFGRLNKRMPCNEKENLPKST